MTKREEIIEKLGQYRDRFNSTYPTYGLGVNEKTTEIIDHCLQEGKTVYELGYLPDPVDAGDIYY